MRLVIACALCLFLALPSVARADAQAEQKARDLYAEGKAAFERQDFEHAYQRFREAYLLAQEPALLYNLASALHRLNRPGEAAEMLRSYLRTNPEEPEKEAIEQRIRTLDEAQKILDAERAHLEETTRRLRSAEAEKARARRRRVVLGVSIGVSAALVIGGVAIGLGVGLQPAYTKTDLTLTATP
jgi:tetratricopeptide (TPR) repeat protein